MGLPDLARDRMVAANDCVEPIVSSHTSNFFVTCAKGTEGALRSELVGLRMRAPKGATGGVSFAGTFMDGMKVCLHSRVAMRVLMEIAAFRARDADDLYQATRDLDWTDFVGRDMTIAVQATAMDNTHLRHSGFAGLKVKDAIVDMLRDRTGRRPDVNPRNPDVAVVLHVRGDDARLFLDLAGEPLHRRGYRVAMVDAPLKENLAAAVLFLSAVPAEAPFIDPMAGSGTLAIEHALLSRTIAPGLRRRFGFERWASPDQRRIFESLKKSAKEAILPKAPSTIVARDIDRTALAAARKNAEAAGVAADISFDIADIATLSGQPEAGTLCTNPPYGERLEAHESGGDVERLYGTMASAFDRMTGWRAVCLSGNPIFPKLLHRRAIISHRLWNGPIEARLLVFNL